VVPQKPDSGRVRDFFQGHAQEFDSIYGHTTRRGSLGRLIDKTLRKSMFLRFQEVLQNTANPEIRTVLDVGCGSGRYCVEFLNQGKRVVGLDLADGMLQLAREATAGSPLVQNVSYVQGDYLQVEFKEKFDAACLMGVLDYVQDPAQMFEKLKRDVTRELYASFPRSSGWLAKQRQLRYKLRNCPLYLYSPQEIGNIMERCGLHNSYVLKDLGRDLFVKVQL